MSGAEVSTSANTCSVSCPGLDRLPLQTAHHRWYCQLHREIAMTALAVAAPRGPYCTAP